MHTRTAKPKAREASAAPGTHPEEQRHKIHLGLLSKPGGGGSSAKLPWDKQERRWPVFKGLENKVPAMVSRTSRVTQ